MRFIVMVLYGTGVRTEECVDLRVKDLDFDCQQIIVRQGKGRRVRVTMLPMVAREALTKHLEDVRRSAVTWRRASFARIHRTTDCAARLEAQAHEALAGLRLHGFPEMTRQPWRVFARNRCLAWVFAIAFAGYTTSPGDLDSC